jgi:aspartyl-tRNA(Asn)/glutamyl-tRNA(Gln) amidotransferase subunit B
MHAATLADISHVRPIIGLEVHVELATRTKMFTRCPSPAHTDHSDHATSPEAGPNTLIDPVVLALPGTLPVINREAVELSMAVGLALNCRIAEVTKWDRKGYFYPDLPKAYQISQYDMPLCFDGSVDLPALDDKGFPDFDEAGSRIGIIRAHLEEDAGKLLHEAPGGGRIDHSIVDLNRAGTPLLEIVTQPDFTSAEQVVLFAKLLRTLLRFVGATQGVMQEGHVRFEPNVNCELTLRDGSTLRTPIVEVKNLNSFKSLRGSVEHEVREQPARWLADRRVQGRGMKVTRGWDDTRGVTFVQREKEDAHDYRYFPDPDIPPLRVGEAWRERARARVGELPMRRLRRYVRESGLASKEAFALIEERETCIFYEAAVEAMVSGGCERSRAGKAAANLVLQQAFKRAKERGVEAHELGISGDALGGLALLRERGAISNQGVETLFDALCDPANRGESPETLATRLGLLIIRDAAAMDAMNAWVRQVIDANPKVSEDVRSGKLQAAGRLVGEVMKLAGGKADAKVVRDTVLKALGVEG